MLTVLLKRPSRANSQATSTPMLPEGNSKYSKALSCPKKSTFLRLHMAAKVDNMEVTYLSQKKLLYI